MTTRLRRVAGNSIIHVAFAFCAMGGWAIKLRGEYADKWKAA